MITEAPGMGVMPLFAHPFDNEAVTRNMVIPIPDLTRKEWVTFVGVFFNRNPRTVTPGFRLGAFEMTVRRLCDLGVMINPRVTRFKGRQVWDADWCDPNNLKAFHTDVFAQYALFAESIRQYAGEEAVRTMVGTTVDGTAATLSGILGVAHRAGMPGLSSWIVNSRDRERFSVNTTSYFVRSNGLF